ncbi:MAG: CRISPR-associated endonuclease Cas2 [Desulfofustis sp. PB-SRB1]|jgi:CRISPR-associated protein Cas2|nr:CRISPR-associated endonuclease Cas2 [Desulfofustis sp. PB-SRB1]MBM1002870.1 CRISPR-associated endonuclease Cas2 [Desulfofustis sp. PB-SRB1]
MKMLAVYDIAETKRLNRVAKILKDYGVRVQYSKFEIDPVRSSAFTVLQERINEVIDPEVDGVKFIPLCRRCLATIEIIGCGTYVDPDAEYYIL